MLQTFARALRSSTSHCIRHASTQASVQQQQHLSVCVVGSGPAGFYTVDKILKQFGDGVRVDLLERLPSPFGLVRTGVAPDHADTKNVINQFTRMAQDQRVSFFGNVCVGKDVSVEELRSIYSLVVLAYGAESDRKLNIPGEDSKGVYAAREFVWWYNGHPDQAHLPIDLSKVESVAVCGIGNVALDCARVLLRPVEQLAPTDIAQHALQQLRQSKVRTVQLCARRGPVQVRAIRVEKTQLVPDPQRGTVAVGTGEFEEYPVQLVLKSIGYKSLPLDGVPFDSKHGVVPNAAGRVLAGVGASPSDIIPGLYVCGWLKRGPTGIIGTNLADAEETVHSIAADAAGLDASAPGRTALQALLRQRGVAVVDWQAWEQLDAAEVAAGQALGAARVKHVSVAATAA